MNTISIVSSKQAAFGMPSFGRVRAASTRALPFITGEVSVVATGFAGSKCTHVADQQIARTDTYSTLPGTSAWSPPN